MSLPSSTFSAKPLSKFKIIKWALLWLIYDFLPAWEKELSRLSNFRLNRILKTPHSTLSPRSWIMNFSRIILSCAAKEISILTHFEKSLKHTHTRPVCDGADYSFTALRQSIKMFTKKSIRMSCKKNDRLRFPWLDFQHQVSFLMLTSL